MDEERVRTSSVALKAFGRIADAWGLTDDQALSLLGDRSAPGMAGALNGRMTELDDGTLERLSLVIGIYAALGALVGDHDAMRRWLRAPNAAALFKGGTALAYMLDNDIDGLRAVRAYVDWHAYVGW